MVACPDASHTIFPVSTSHNSREIFTDVYLVDISARPNADSLVDVRSTYVVSLGRAIYLTPRISPIFFSTFLSRMPVSSYHCSISAYSCVSSELFMRLMM